MLDKTRDPFVLGTLQMMTMENAIRANNAKAATVEAFGAEAAEVKKPDERSVEGRYGRPPRGKDYLEVRVDGKPQAYIVDQYVADIFNKIPFENQHTWWWYNKYMNAQRAAFITLSPNFQFQNFFRDIQRTVTNIGWGVVPNLATGFRESYHLATGKQSALGDEAARAGAINWRNRSQWLDGAQPVDRVLRTKDEVNSGLTKAQDYWRGVSDFLKIPLNTIEGATKLAAYKTLRDRGMSMGEAAYVTRTHTGTPDALVKGSWSTRMNQGVMFSNMYMNSWMSSLDMVRNPSTREGVVLRQMVTSVIPKTMQYMLAKGLVTSLAKAAFGEESEQHKFFQDVENLYAAIPDYELDRFLVLPKKVYTDKNGKDRVEFLRIAQDQNAAMASNILINMFDGLKKGEPIEAVSNSAQQVWSDAPSLTPLLGATAAWVRYAFGKENPRDEFRRRDIIPRSVYVEGQMTEDASKKMLFWTLEKILGSTYSTIVNLTKKEDPLTDSKQTRIGPYADVPAYSTEERQIQDEQKTTDRLEQIEGKKILERGDSTEIQGALDTGVLTKKKVKSFEKTDSLTLGQKFERELPVSTLERLREKARERGRVARESELDALIKEKTKKSKTQQAPSPWVSPLDKTNSVNSKARNLIIPPTQRRIFGQ